MNYLNLIKEYNKKSNARIAVIDDDPTGCQTVHSVPIMFEWDKQRIIEVFDRYQTVFFLTNSRALNSNDAEIINKELAYDLKSAIKDRWNLKIISRSDSTLRGHFMEEVFALERITGPYDGVIFAPFFEEGKRLTFNDTHYIHDDEKGLMPVSESEFAKDKVFGYPMSNLAEWIEFKTSGRISKNRVLSVSIEDIRTGGPEKVADKIFHASSLQPIIINAMHYEDLEKVVWGICLAEMAGKNFLYRTAASFVRVRAGMEKKELIFPPEKMDNFLIIVGSYTEKTTSQVEELIKHTKCTQLIIKLDKIFSDFDNYLKELIDQANYYIGLKHNLLLITEREYKDFGTHYEIQKMTKRISSFLSEFVARLRNYPGVIIAKGGITSFEVAKNGLSIGEAEVIGQIEAGVPLLRLSANSKSPGSYYVIFPGNIGNKDSLVNVINKLIKLKNSC